MEEDIKMLEKLINDFIEFEEKNKLNHFVINIKEKTAIQNLIARYKELEEENKKITDEYLIQRYLINSNFLSEYIPKSKIKEKIEELKYEMLKENESIEQFYKLKYCYKVLQQLLEDFSTTGNHIPRID